MKILSVKDPAFRKYGRVITNVNFTELVEEMKKTPIPEGVEYHRSSEINVAATDAILLLGQLADVAEDFTYDTSKMEAFLVPAGTGVEVFATSLHYAPCGVDGQGFQVAIVLPQGTNYPLQGTHQKVDHGCAPSEDALLAATNKWLIGHAEGGLPEGSFIGLIGENLDVSK